MVMRRGLAQVLSCCVVACGVIASTTLAQREALGILERRPADADRLQWHIADPEQQAVEVRGVLEAITRPADRKFAEAVLERLESIVLDRQVRLSLQDVLHRAVVNSFSVRVDSYNPAISTASVVEAEAAFDAVFFTTASNNKVDAPAPSQLVGTSSDTVNLSGGIRKLLPTGGRLTAQLGLTRNETNNQFQIVNPVYTSFFQAELAQPILRGAGLDFNRAQIRISRNDLRVSREGFKRRLRDVLVDTERAYWRLVQARREVAIRARVLSEFEKVYDYLWQRRDFDVYQIQLSETQANIERSKADFIRVGSQVRNAEDTLLALLNDPELNLVDDIEIIPTDFPTTDETTIDRVADVQVALDHRSELEELRVGIETAGLRVGQAKNQALPRFDFQFRFTSSGLGRNAHNAFGQVSENDFINYFVGFDLELPIGNRAREATLRRARLGHAQTIAALKARIEGVILEVNTAARAVRTAFDRIDPNLESAEANESQVASVIARQERKDFTALNQELGARNGLANSRSALLNDLVDYSIAIIELERAKGTVLGFNNIELAEDGR